MGKSCQICSHDKRLRIERAVLAGKSIAEVSRTFGVSYHSVWSHARHHISRQMLKSGDIRQQLELGAISHEFQSLYERAKELLNRAEVEGPSHVSASLLRELRGTIESIAKWGITLETLQGQPQPFGDTNSGTLREALARLSADEVRLFRYLMAKANGQETPGDLPATLPVPVHSRPRQVIDVGPVRVKPEEEIFELAVVEPPAIEPPAIEPKPRRPRRPEPSEEEVLRSRRMIRDRILDSF